MDKDISDNFNVWLFKTKKCPYGQACEIQKAITDKRYWFEYKNSKNDESYKESEEEDGEDETSENNEDISLKNLCPFAHSKWDYRPYNVKEYTPKVLEGGKRSHSVVAYLNHPDNWKTRMCANGGNCPTFGCSYAHGKHDLRTSEQNWKSWNAFNDSLAPEFRPKPINWNNDKKPSSNYKFPTPM